MKNMSKVILAVVLAVLTAAMIPAQVFADSAPDYISEVKVFEGSYSEAESEGYTMLKDDSGKVVDINKDSGSTSIGAKGNKAVYLGYKTTKIKSEAITDLALMNMKGGYSVQEYEALMETQMNSQIIPFVERFIVALNEFRENLKSKNSDNRQRAEYMQIILNKLIDDDTGKGLGDLLVNDTIYEMAKKQYEALSDKEKEKTNIYELNTKVKDGLAEAEKNEHADILTILAQSNGRATHLMETLVLRAADTNDETWLDRFSEITADDLADILEMSPADADKELAKLFDDDAQMILNMWDSFRSELEQYDYYKSIADKYDQSKIDKESEKMDAFKELDEDATDEELVEALEGYGEALQTASDLTKALKVVYIHNELDEYEYDDGTLLDFFLTDSNVIAKNIEKLYPLVASLTEGQRSGLELLSLDELVMMSVTDPDVYNEEALNDLEEASIYDGVDRGIYQKGGVALTSDAMRTKALEQSSPEESPLSALTIAGIVVTGVFMLAAISSGIAIKLYSAAANYVTRQLIYGAAGSSRYFTTRLVSIKDGIPQFENRCMNTIYASRSTMCKYLTVGFSVAAVVLAGVTTYLTYRDMVNHYNVDFTPIPHYMVDEKDITVTIESGEKVVIKNQSAYYKAVESNRKEGAEYYGKIGSCADLNGCVNPQWLALYAARNEAECPIIASSFKVVIGNTTVPQGYETGIHFFGEKAAFNLNNKLYCWNQNTKSIMVYYKTDKAAAEAGTAGSNFTAGTLALTGGCGLITGALASAICITAFGKKKKKAAT